MKKLTLFLLFFCLVTTKAFGYDFEADSLNVIKAINRLDAKFANDPSQIRLTILFDEQSGEGSKQKLDLVKLKSDLANSLALKIKVTNPYTVSDYLKDRKLNAQDVINRSDARFKAVNELKSTHFLLVDTIVEDNKNVVVFYQIYEALEFSGRSFKSSHPIDSPGLAQKKEGLDIKKILPDNEALQKAGVSVKNFFLETGSYGKTLPAWNYFHPTAFLNSDDNSFLIDTNFWLYNTEKVDIGIRHIRADFRFRILQGGIAQYGNDFKGYQAGYLHLKVNILNELNINIPLFLSLGIKVRHYLNKNSPHLPSAADKKADALTFYAALNYRLTIAPSYIIFLGSYIDNVYINFDVDLLLPYQFLVGSSLLIPRISKTAKEPGQALRYSDFNFVFYLKHLTNNYFNIGLNYEVRPQALSLAIGVKI